MSFRWDTHYRNVISNNYFEAVLSLNIGSKVGWLYFHLIQPHTYTGEYSFWYNSAVLGNGNKIRPEYNFYPRPITNPNLVWAWPNSAQSCFCICEFLYVHSILMLLEPIMSIGSGNCNPHRCLCKVTDQSRGALVHICPLFEISGMRKIPLSK